MLDSRVLTGQVIDVDPALRMVRFRFEHNGVDTILYAHARTDSIAKQLLLLIDTYTTVEARIAESEGGRASALDIDAVYSDGNEIKQSTPPQGVSVPIKPNKRVVVR